MNSTEMRTAPMLVLLAMLYLIGCTPSEKTSSEVPADSTIVTGSGKARIDSTLKAFVDENRIAGVSALIYEKDKEVYFNAFGSADKEAGIPMDRNTLVRIYSMTKPITGVALMQLFEKGAFQLDDPISKYAPEFAQLKVFAGIDNRGKLQLEPLKRAITIRDLTRHTAGFARPEHPQLGELVNKADAMNSNNTLAQMAAKLSKLPLAFQPGEEWSYGISVDVQAYLVEKISGKPFDAYVKENILTPLAMSQTAYVPQDMKRLATMYRKTDEGKLEPVTDEKTVSFNQKDWPLKPGGFGFTSTIDDYMKFARMLLHKGKLDSAEILNESTVRLMATNQLSDSVTERMWLPSKGQVGFGIDFAVRVRPPQGPDENNGSVGEFFWDGAASTLFWVDPENDLCAVLFVQIFPFDRALHKSFRDAVYGVYNAKAKL
jgi:CubicO group peptidase (beta-lactamase class C family)